MKNELRTKILEMTLAVFGASACASTQAADPAKVPSAAEVKDQRPASHGEASCSAAGCGAKASDPAPSDQKAVEASPAIPAKDAKDVAGASAMATPAAAPAPAAAAPAQTDAASAPPAKPVAAKARASKPKPAKKKAADDEGCGAGSCASAK